VEQAGNGTILRRQRGGMNAAALVITAKSVCGCCSFVTYGSCAPVAGCYVGADWELFRHWGKSTWQKSWQGRQRDALHAAYFQTSVFFP